MRVIIGSSDSVPNKNELILPSTLKLTINLLSQIFISFVVLVCLWFACRSIKLTIIELHIMLCVLGYQFFMSQGILVLSKYNSCSLYIKRKHRRYLHWFMEFIGTMFVIIGSIEVIKFKHDHFNTRHGILGLCALLTSVISIFNGMLTSLASTMPSSLRFGINLTTASKCIHGVTGIGTLFLSAASLHYGFDKGSFRRWIDNDNFIIVLKVFTWMFTTFVGFEFLLIMAKRFRCKKSNQPEEK